jgi:hypothetical protein
MWCDACLRSAGFPAERVLEICDDGLAAAADDLADGEPATRDHYAKVFAEAVDRLTVVIQRTAGERAFREAVAWQNPGLVRDCLDKAAAGERRNAKGRYHELTIANYLQRYCLKNDTVGFFGPVGWVLIGTEDIGVSMVPGPELLARRTTYFEGWAIDAIADVIGNRPDVWPWLRPRVVPSAMLTGRVLRLPFERPTTLAAAEIRVLAQCNGRRTVRDIAGVPLDPEIVATLLRLREHGAVRIDLAGPLVTWPERALAERIDALADPVVRARARAPLDELVSARDAVAAAAGDPDRLVRASDALAGTFERITGSASTRRSGATYAARTLVYEDTVRGADVKLGRQMTDRLAGPLGLVLDSAMWLANTVADRFEVLAGEMLDRELAGTGSHAMPLLPLLTALMPALTNTPEGRPASSIVDEVVAEFRQRWRRVVDLPLDAFDRTSRHHVSTEVVAGRVAQEFGTDPPRWSGARWYSPDLMMAAADATALARGDLSFVLGELHCACNTLESQMFVAQHDDQDRLRAAMAASHPGGRRVFTIPRSDSPLTTSRMARATELMLPSYTYMCIGAESKSPPPGATVVSALEMTVQRRGGELVVCHLTGDVECSLLDAAADPLSLLVCDAFQPFDGAHHRPRITIGCLVVAREAWTFQATELAWAFVEAEQQRFAQARRWRARHALPERIFLRVPVERKPMAVDFRSLPLVNLLAKSIRRTAEAGPGEVAVTEMLPDLDALWARDAAGGRYTAELRLVVSKV